jgi:hypothetical protein
VIAGSTNRVSMQRPQQSEIGFASRGHQTGIRDIGDRDETHVSVLAVEQATGSSTY